jgi:cytochrome bd-type quinol oxidase subunit 1
MFNGGAASDPMPTGMAVFLGVLPVIVGVLLVEVGRQPTELVERFS